MINPYVNSLRCVVFDIETMGLAPWKDMIVNAGFYEPETGELIQYFAESPADEINLISDTLNTLGSYDVVVTYNGDSFDLPFVTTRAKKYRLTDSLPRFWSIDMYRWLRSYWPQAKMMRSLRQKAIEIALGFADDRTDEIPGGECISLYNRYLMDGSEEPKELILLHNADDVRQLGRIFTEVKALPYDRIAFEQGFCFKTDDFGLFKVTETRLDRNFIFVKCNKIPGGIPSVIFDDAFELEYDPFTGDISLKIRLSEYEGRRYADLTKLPVDPSDFKDLSGYHSDFLVCADEKEVKYREVNELIRHILSGKGLF